MNFSAYLRDRAAYIVAYVAFAFLTVAVVQLDLRLAGASLRYVNVLYLLLLGVVGLSLLLWYDWLRQRRFFDRLREVAAGADLDAAVALAEPVTHEQELVRQAWERLNARLQEELAAERERGAARVAIVSQWAHHMKTPISVIDLLLQTAARLPADPALAQVLASIAEENEHLDAQLQMLLSVNRLDDFAADLHVDKVDLVALARAVVNDNRRAFIAHRVYPRIEEPQQQALPPELLQVETDAKWMRLVLQQIVSNAIKYAARPDGEGRVRIGFSRHGRDVVLEVEDNGVGIPPEDLERVFDPFFTGANGRRYPRATGMGLYLAREACRRLGHGITITSTPGAGTCVRLRFFLDRTLHAGWRPAKK